MARGRDSTVALDAPVAPLSPPTDAPPATLPLADGTGGLRRLAVERAGDRDRPRWGRAGDRDVDLPSRERSLERSFDRPRARRRLELAVESKNDAGLPPLPLSKLEPLRPRLWPLLRWGRDFSSRLDGRRGCCTEFVEFDTLQWSPPSDAPESLAALSTLPMLAMLALLYALAVLSLGCRCRSFATTCWTSLRRPALLGELAASLSRGRTWRPRRPAAGGWPLDTVAGGRGVDCFVEPRAALSSCFPAKVLGEDSPRSREVVRWRFAADESAGPPPGDRGWNVNRFEDRLAGEFAIESRAGDPSPAPRRVFSLRMDCLRTSDAARSASFSECPGDAGVVGVAAGTSDWTEPDELLM